MCIRNRQWRIILFQPSKVFPAAIVFGLVQGNPKPGHRMINSGSPNGDELAVRRRPSGPQVTRGPGYNGGKDWAGYVRGVAFSYLDESVGPSDP